MEIDLRSEDGASPERAALSGPLATLIVIGMAAFTCFVGLSSGPPLGDHEAIVAQSARQMRQTGDWLIPYLNDVPFIQKPPLQFWLAALSSFLVDPPELTPPVSVSAARFPSAAAGFLTVLVVFWLARRMYGQRAAMVAAVITASCGATMFYARNAQTEMLLTLLCTASLALFWVGARPGAPRRYLYGFYVCFALAMLAKAPLPLATVGLVLFVYWLLTVPLARALGAEETSDAAGRAGFGAALMDQLRGLRRLQVLQGAAIFAVIFLPWPIYVYLHEPNALELWRTEFLDRYSGELTERPKAWYYYLPLVFALTAPFCLSVPEALAAPLRRVFRRERAGLLFALTWVLVQVVFLSTSSFKRPHYMLATVPGLALLLAPVIERMFFGPRRWPAVIERRVGAAVLGVFLVAAIGFGVYMQAWSMKWSWVLRLAAPVGLGGVIAATLLYLRERRAASLAVLSGAFAVCFVWSWSALGRSEFGREALHLANALDRMRIGENDRITWADDGRQDARVVYYCGHKINPLYDVIELASRRRGRRVAPTEIMKEGAKRIIERLRSEVEEYFVFEADKLNLMNHYFDVPAREVIRVSKGTDDPADEWVIITNAWNTGEEEDFADDPQVTWSLLTSAQAREAADPVTAPAPIP